MMLSVQLPHSALAPVSPTGIVPRYRPTFDRVSWDCEATVKSTMTLNVEPSMQVVSGVPSGFRGFDAPVMATSPEVQPKPWLLPAAVNKSCAQVPVGVGVHGRGADDAGAARNVSARAAIIQ